MKDEYERKKSEEFTINMFVVMAINFCFTKREFLFWVFLI